MDRMFFSCKQKLYIHIYSLGFIKIALNVTAYSIILHKSVYRFQNILICNIPQQNSFIIGSIYLFNLLELSSNILIEKLTDLAGWSHIWQLEYESGQAGFVVVPDLATTEPVVNTKLPRQPSCLSHRKTCICSIF